MGENDAWSQPGTEEPSHFPDRPMAYYIRRRPGMFLGSLGPDGLHGLAWELLEYGLAEVRVGCGTSLRVRINPDGSLSVADDGRGLPVEPHAGADLTTLEWILTCSTGVEVRGQERVFQTGLHGVGARAVTALSDWAEATVCRDGRVYQQRYERGLAVGDVCDTGQAGTRIGTAITFHPDPEIFPDAAFDRDRLGARLRELAFLNRGLVTRLTEERTGRDDTSHYPGGVADFVKYLNRGAEVLHEPITIHEEVRAVAVAVALQYTTGREGQVRCYANNAYNFLGGTHLRGFRSALTHTLGRWARTERLSQQSPAPTGKDFRDGLTAVVSVTLPDPRFLSQTRCLLYNPEVTGVVAGVVRKGLTRFLAENPEAARRISTKVVAAAKARTTRGPSKDQG